MNLSLSLTNNLGLSPRAGLGPELVSNGGFADATDWNLGAGVTIGSGKANWLNVAALDDSLYQLAIVPATGALFTLSFTVSGYTSGDVRPYAGNFALGSAVSANGTYVFTGQDRSTGNANLIFKSPSGSATLAIDDVSMRLEL
jgi:hypothetical protein